MTCGVYEIVAPSGSRYVGSSVDMRVREKSHFWMLRKGTHHSRALQAAWNKYGSRLLFRPLLVCSPALRLFYEQRAYNALRPSYNCSPNVSAGHYGHKHSAETRARLSALRKGLTRSPTSRAKQKSTLESRRPSPARETCELCGQRLVIGSLAQGRKRRFCSRLCASRAMARLPKPGARKPRGKCRGCGSDISWQKPATHLFCSRACANRANRAVYKARRQQLAIEVSV
jgi:hypothetical protein